MSNIDLTGITRKFSKTLVRSTAEAPLRLRQGIITAVNATSPVTVTFTLGGQTGLVAVVMAPYAPAVDDAAFFIDMGAGRWMAIGCVAV